MQKKLSKIFVLIDLLIQEIEDPVTTPTKETKKIQDKLRNLEKDLIPILDRFYNKGVSQSNFLQLCKIKLIIFLIRNINNVPIKKTTTTHKTRNCKRNI